MLDLKEYKCWGPKLWIRQLSKIMELVLKVESYIVILWYQRLVGKLVYLRITCPDMSFGVGHLLPFTYVIENGFTYLTSARANVTYASVKHVKNTTRFVEVIIFMSK